MALTLCIQKPSWSPVKECCDGNYKEREDQHGLCFGEEPANQEIDDAWTATDAENVPVPWKLLSVSATEYNCVDQKYDVASLSSVLKSFLNCSPATESRVGRTAKQRRSTGAKEHRWWTQVCASQLCPLSGFPIGMLPYPPFKWRSYPDQVAPHRLVDGKYLALMIISSGDVNVCGRGLVATDVEALDSYVHRCKLGPFRLGKALALAKEVVCCSSQEAAQELDNMCNVARVELSRLQVIQKNRMLQIQRTSSW
eukprot:CAMPEP_0194490610 /NCGR_PEP_ID=MMETSP0253-20130528/9771_1 /TAXON_ID=2966 /ORGANISM="Noctiluca scintillans" /LENGTH=253 /DNA_ID=CAMNT_0039331257 /DNA_START=39 /DNA_END=800 /DNA_ORIENTATION=-